jgi:trimethylamine--corrinoid protein Co-methyltransferase
MDMRTGNLAYGAPEYSLACLAAVDYFNDIGVPSWIGAGCSDAHIVNAQAAAEAGMNMLAAVLSGTSFVHNLGYLSSGKTGSLEMLVLCDELAGMVRRIAAGTVVNEETLAVDVTRRAANRNSYLSDEHTLKHVRTEMWIPALFQRINLSSWHKIGSKAVGERIREKLMTLC